MQNTNPERKSLSELIKGVGEGKVILVDDSYDVAKHADLIAKIQAKHPVVVVHINDLLIEDSEKIKKLLSAENKPNPFGGGIAEMLQESTERLIRDMQRMELEMPPLTEKVEHKETKVHDFGHRKQAKQYNNFKPLPKKNLGFRRKH